MIMPLFGIVIRWEIPNRDGWHFLYPTFAYYLVIYSTLFYVIMYQLFINNFSVLNKWFSLNFESIYINYANIAQTPGYIWLSSSSITGMLLSSLMHSRGMILSSLGTLAYKNSNPLPWSNAIETEPIK